MGHFAVIVALALALAACGSTMPPGSVSQEAEPDAAAADASTVCRADVDCGAGMVCGWATGDCSAAGQCVPDMCEPPCLYFGPPRCGCDGKPLSIVSGYTVRADGGILLSYFFWSGPLGTCGGDN